MNLNFYTIMFKLGCYLLHQPSLILVDQITSLFFSGYVSCGQKPPESECPEGFFHCIGSKACVPQDQLCDLNDDCGDR